MFSKIIKNTHWLFLFSIFFFLYAPNLLREGMFVDGIWYAAIGNNLANGIGTFWQPSFTNTIHKSFYEHPPLAFGIQSLFFKTFGNSFWVERFYCFIVFLITILLIIKIWFLLYEDKKYRKLYYFPLAIWMLNFQVFFAYPNNILECTLTIFTLSAILFLLKSLKHSNWKYYYFIIIASLFIYAGFLTKGLVALFPLSFFILHQIISKKNISENIYSTLILLSGFLCSLFVLLQFEAPKDFFVTYFNSQVIEALNGNRTENMRDTRFYIVKSFFNGIPLSAGIPLIIILITYFNKQKIQPKSENKKLSFFFLLIAISASLPIIISQKQAGYYLIPSIPIYTLAIAIFTAPSLYYLTQKLNKNKITLNIISTTLLLTLFISIYLAINNIGTIDKRDFTTINDINEITKIVPNNSIISIKSDYFEHSLHGFFQRYNYISLDTLAIKKRKYLLIKKDIDTLNIYNYTKLNCNTKSFNAYLKINP